MKNFIILMILFCPLLCMAQSYIVYDSTHILKKDFLYKIDQTVYFRQNDTIFKASLIGAKTISGGIKSLPNTSYNQDMYQFTRKGYQAQVLFLTGGLIAITGGAIAAALDNPDLGIGISSIGVIFSISGFFVNMSAWRIGKIANQRNIAIEYDIRK